MPLGSNISRWLRMIPWLCFGAFAAWVLWLGVTRWGGVPADVRGADAEELPPLPVDPACDRTEELLAALKLLPAEDVELTLPAPPTGKQWRNGRTTMRLEDAMDGSIRGPWSPADRPAQQLLIELVETPQVRRGLDALLAMDAGEFDSERVFLSEIDRAIQLLTFRSRYLRAGLQDIQGGLDDLFGAYRLAAICYKTSKVRTRTMTLVIRSPSELSSVSFAIGHEVRVVAELRRLAYENSLVCARALNIEERLREMSPEPSAIWDHAVQERIAWLRRQVNLAFTDDGQGDGWLVLSHLRFPLDLTAARPERAGLWNMFSPIFNDRRAVTCKIEDLRQTLEAVRGLSYLDAHERLRAIPGRTFNYLDGPVVVDEEVSWDAVALHCYLAFGIAHRRALAADLALSAYRAKHGEYPASLTELVGRYLREVPADPFGGEALCYRREGNEGYLLYTVGPNLRDDGGVETGAHLHDDPGDNSGDVVFDHRRETPRWDPELEEVKP